MVQASHSSSIVHRYSLLHLFTGREDVLSAFHETVNEAQLGQLQILSVKGGSGAGKTFLSAYIVKHICPTIGWTPIYLSFSTASESDFQSVLDQLEVGLYAPSRHLLPHLAVHTYRTERNNLQKAFDRYRSSISASLKQVIVGSVESVQLKAQLHERLLQLRNDLLMALAEPCEQLTRPLCILLDDYDCLAKTDAELTTWVLREVFTELSLRSPQKVVVVILGQVFPQEATVGDHTYRIELQNFDSADIAAYVHKRRLLGSAANGSPVEVSAELVEAFQNVTGGHPLFLNLACTYLESFEVAERTPSRLTASQPLTDDGTRGIFWVKRVTETLAEPYSSLLDAATVLRTFDRVTLEEALRVRGNTMTDAEYEQFLHYAFCSPYAEMGQTSTLRLQELTRRTRLEMLQQHAPDTLLELRRHFSSYYRSLEQTQQTYSRNSTELERLYCALQIPDLAELALADWIALTDTAIQDCFVLDACRSVHLIKQLRSEGWHEDALARQAEFWYYQGKCRELAACWAEAIDAFEQAVMKCQELRDQQLAVKTLNDIGNIYYEQGELDKALANYQRASDLFDQTQNKERIASLQNSIGNVYYEQGELDKALANYQRASDLFDQTANDNGRALTLNNIGNVYYEQGEPTEALNNYNRAYNLFDQLGDQDGKVSTLNNINRASRIYRPLVDGKLFKIRGLRWVRQRYQEDFDKQCYKEIGGFDQFRSISQQEKRRIRSRVVFSISQIQAYQAWWAVKNILVDNGFIVGLIAGAISSLLAAPILFHQGEHWALTWIVLPLVAVILAVLFVYVSDPLLRRYNYSRASSFILLILSVLTVWILGTSWLSQVPSFIRDGLRAVITGVGVYMGIIWITGLCAQFINLLVRRAKIKRFTTEEVIQSLCLLLSLVEEAGPDQWQLPSFKLDSIYNLEWIAQRIGIELPRSLQGTDAETNAWLYREARAIAADVRNLKQLVLFPKEGAREQLLQSIATRLVYAAEGSWGLFGRAEAIPARSRLAQFLRILRILMTIIIPISIVGVAVVNPFHFDALIRSTIITFVLGFALVHLLSLLNPRSRSDLEETKSLLETPAISKLVDSFRSNVNS